MAVRPIPRRTRSKASGSGRRTSAAGGSAPSGPARARAALAGQALVRVRVLGRDDALVAPPRATKASRGRAPRGARRRTRRRPAGERDAERRAAAGALRDPARGEPARSAATRRSVRPPRRSGRGRRSRAGRERSLDVFGSRRPGRASRPSTSTSSTSPAGSCSSRIVAGDAPSRLEKERLRLRARNAERRRLGDVRPEVRDRGAPRLGARPGDVGHRDAVEARRPGRSARGGPLARVDETVGDADELLELRRAERQRAASAGGRSRSRSSGMTTLAGAAARRPQSREEMTSEQTSLLAAAHEAAEVDLALEDVLGSVRRGKSRIVRDGWRSARPASVPVACLGPALRHPRDVRHHAGAQPGRRPRLRGGVAELGRSRSSSRMRRGGTSASARNGRRGGGARRPRQAPRSPPRSSGSAAGRASRAPPSRRRAPIAPPPRPRA